jgi:2-polyprenyl-3-methyl-5-hydroxy-6-metoxy-1,4-benzoquinol methylase
MKYNYKTDNVRGVEYKYSAEWIHELESEKHWRLYWNQQKLIQNKVKKGDRVLEIGVGSGFTSNYLRSKGVKVKTLDIDSKKKPDITANIVEYQFAEYYDHILAFEVFEHIPFREFKMVLRKIRRVCQKYVFLSVPRNEKVWMSCVFKFPKLSKREFRLVTLRRKITTPAHFWELDDGSVSTQDFEQEFYANGIKILSKKNCFSQVFYSLNPTGTI